MTKSNSTLLFVTLIFLSLLLACNQAETTTKVETPAQPTPAATQAETKPVKPATDISGSYSITGSNENGAGEYNGDLNITKREEVYQFSWASGGRTYDGVGVQTDDTVAVSFTEGADGKGCGVVLYKIATNGDLDGKAGYWGVNSSETEKAKRDTGTDLEGRYEVSGTNTDGKPYKSSLNVKKNGDGYSFVWSGGTQPVNGFGIRMGELAAIGLGQASCGFVMYEVKPDGTLEGKWGGQSSTSFGTETAKKK